MLQELNVLPALSIAENLFLHRLPSRFGFVDRARLCREAEAALACVGLEGIDPATLASALGIGLQ
jgi:ribose transport system ATP-binding protein